MYWNKINDACHEFSRRYQRPPRVIYMNKGFYDGLFEEMVGDQKLALIKANSVRGLKVVISELDSEFVISSVMNNMRVKY
jgi:hypothetical protein